MTAAPRFAVPRDDRRDCALYRIYVLHPVTGKVVLGYIGETGRMPFTRFMEHLYDQPWGDTIVGHPRVDPREFSGKPQVLAAEEAAVRAEKPLYNIEYQKGAPHQIPQWTAREQRAERDRRQGAVTPDWAAKGHPGPSTERPQRSAPRKCRPDVRRSRLPLKWRRRRNTALAWSGGWLGFTLALWAVLAVAGRHAGVAWQVWPVLSGAVCGVPVAVKVRAVWRRSTVRRTLRRWT